MRAFLILALTATAAAQPVTVTISNRIVSTFDPSQALGAGIDGHEKGEIARFLSASNITLMRAAGLKPLSYRLRTELAGEAWHWNPKGTWSDPEHRQGYWVSDATPGDPIDVSYGYRLPRRGNTQDQANDDGYSRLDDGDPATFWKSNPYLDDREQWVAIDLGKPTRVNTVHIAWGVPAAARYVLQYAAENEIDVTYAGAWRELPKSTVVRTRWLRILLQESTHEAPAGSMDARDRMGFAIREIEAGLTDAAGRFHDAIRHAANGKEQTPMFVSSTDSWHRESDLDTRVEQPGFDRVFQGGLTNGLPALMPAAILYDTPENAAAEIRYFRARGFRVEEVELGEEPEEQNIPPEYYGELFLKWSEALHAVDASLRIGGPSLVLLQADQDREPSWTKRLIAYLSRRGAPAFFSFEWYPFDEVCAPVHPQLARGSRVLKDALARLEKDGVPREMPRYITEYGYSAYGAEPEVAMEGALFNADIVGTFFMAGGARAFLYGYEPNELINEKGCSWGNNMLLLDRSGTGQPPAKLATYYGAQLLATEWAQGSGGPNRMLAASASSADIGAYALHRPDGLISVLLINRSAAATHAVRIAGARGPGDLFQYSGAQYRWAPHKDQGHPAKDEPPSHGTVEMSSAVTLPPLSMSVLRFSSVAVSDAQPDQALRGMRMP